MGAARSNASAGPAPVDASPRAGHGSGFLESVWVVASGGIAAQAIQIAAAPVLTRLYDPAAIGTLALLTAIAGVLGVLATWRYEIAVVLPTSDTAALNVVGLCLLLAAATALVTGGVVILFGDRIGALHEGGAVAAWLWVVPILLLLDGVFQAFRHWAIRKQLFSLTRLYRIVQSGLASGGQILAGFSATPGAAHLIVATMVANLIATVVLVRGGLAGLAPEGLLRHLSGARILKQLRAFRSYPIYVLPYSIAEIATQRAIFLLLAIYASIETTGFFALAMRSTFLPVSLAAGAINVVFFQRASTEFDREALEGLVRRVLRLQVWLGVPLTVFFTANAVTIFAFVFGAGWQEAGAFAALLAPPSFLVLLTSWLDRIYDVLGRQKVRLVLELIYDAILMATLLTGFALGAGAWQAVLAFSVINSVYHLVWLGVTFAVARFSAELYVETLAQVAGMTALSLLVHLGASKFFSPIGYSAVILLFVVVVSAAVAGRALVGALRSGGAERPAMPR